MILLRSLDDLKIDLDDPHVLVGISDDERPGFTKRLTAIKAVRDGVGFPSIQAETGLVRQQVAYRIRRLNVIAVDGKPLRLRALLDGAQQQRSYPTDAASMGRPVAGSRKALFKQHPDIHSKLVDLALNGKHPNFTTRLKRESVKVDLVHELLLVLCTEKGISAPNWPYCGQLEGKRAIRDWMLSLRAQELQDQQRARAEAFQQEAKKHSALRCYARVEADAHSIAVKWILRFPSLRGEGYIDMVVDRLFLIALLECSSGAILGRSYAFGTNYSGSDLMRAVNHALLPWKKLTGYESYYQQKDGMPTGEAVLQWRAWDTLGVDSAMAHSCSVALVTLARAVNCVVEIGPVGVPDVRAAMEGFFSELNEVIHQLPGFEGKPHERDGKSGRVIIDFDLLIAVIDLLIARFNGSIAPGTSMTHIELLKHSTSKEAAIVRRVPEAVRPLVERYDTFDTARIGKDKRGHAVLRWQSATYEGLGLTSASDLIGQKVLLAADSQDPRVIRAWLDRDGTDLGDLEIERRYRSTPASVTTRQHIKRRVHADSFLRNAMNLPLAFRQLQEARNHKRSADCHELARLVIEQVFARSRSASGQPAAGAAPTSSASMQLAPVGSAPLPATAPTPPSPAPLAPVISLAPLPAPGHVKHLSEVAVAARAISSV